MDWQTTKGISLRDYFAAVALQGECAASQIEPADPNTTAVWAYQVADAMLVARDKALTGEEE